VSPRDLLTWTIVAAVSPSAACGDRPNERPPLYAPTPTRADAAGPIVPPVYLRVVADRRAALERATDAAWTVVCEDPCNGYVPAFGAYRIALRDRQVWSAPFTLPGGPGTAVVLKVDADGKVWSAGK
jgi:hypothetical protein